MKLTAYKVNGNTGVSLEDVDQYDIKCIIDVTKEEVDNLMDNPSQANKYFN